MKPGVGWSGTGVGLDLRADGSDPPEGVFEGVAEVLDHEGEHESAGARDAGVAVDKDVGAPEVVANEVGSLVEEAAQIEGLCVLGHDPLRDRMIGVTMRLMLGSSLTSLVSMTERTAPTRCSAR